MKAMSRAWTAEDCVYACIDTQRFRRTYRAKPMTEMKRSGIEVKHGGFMKKDMAERQHVRDRERNIKSRRMGPNPMDVHRTKIKGT